jgi:hypothetical protein
VTATKDRCHAGSLSIAITVTEPIIINEQIDATYKIAANTAIHINDSHDMKFGNVLIDLKSLSNANGGCTNFVVDGAVDFGLLVDPEMDCHIAGTDDGKIGIDETNLNKGKNIVGVVIGRKQKTGN